MAFLSPIVANLSLTKTFSSPIGEILPEKIGAVSATAKKTPWHVEVSVKKVKVESEVYICHKKT